MIRFGRIDLRRNSVKQTTMKLMRVIHKLFGLVILFVSLLVLLSLIHCATQSKYTARRLPSYGTPPSPRRNYGFGVDAEVGEIYVYGGDASKDLWKFVVEGTTVYWEEIGFTGTSPSTTSGSGLFVDAGRIFVFGGFENDLSVVSFSFHGNHHVNLCRRTICGCSTP